MCTYLAVDIFRAKVIIESAKEKVFMQCMRFKPLQEESELRQMRTVSLA